MKHMKKPAAAILTLLFAFCLTAPGSTVVQAAVKVPKKVVEYVAPMTSNQFSIKISGMKKSQKITAVKSSNKKVKAIEGLYVEGEGGVVSYTVDNDIKKNTSADISFKIAGKKYKTKVIAKTHTNPVKALSISGVSVKGKKNLASLTNKLSMASTDGTLKGTSGLKVTKTITNPKLQVTAKKGWKIQKIVWVANGKGSEKNYKKPVAKVNLKMTKKPLNKIVPKRGANITVTFVNTKDKGNLNIYYFIG